MAVSVHDTFKPRPMPKYATPEKVNDYRVESRIRVQPDTKWVLHFAPVQYEVNWYGEPKSEEAAIRYRKAVHDQGMAAAKHAIGLFEKRGWQLYPKTPPGQPPFGEIRTTPTYRADTRTDLFDKKVATHDERGFQNRDLVASDRNSNRSTRAYVVILYFIRPADLIPEDVDIDEPGRQEGFVPVNEMRPDLQEMLKAHG